MRQDCFKWGVGAKKKRRPLERLLILLTMARPSKSRNPHSRMDGSVRGAPWGLRPYQSFCWSRKEECALSVGCSNGGTGSWTSQFSSEATTEFPAGSLAARPWRAHMCCCLLSELIMMRNVFKFQPALWKNFGIFLMGVYDGDNPPVGKHGH